MPANKKEPTGTTIPTKNNKVYRCKKMNVKEIIEGLPAGEEFMQVVPVEGQYFLVITKISV